MSATGSLLNKDPRYGNTPITAVCQVSTTTAVANTDLDVTPTGSVQIPFSGVAGVVPAGGLDVTRLFAQLVEPALTGAGVLAVYVTKDGANFYRRKSIAHSAQTISATVAPADDDFGFTDASPLRLQAGDALYIQARGASAVTNAFHIVAEATEFRADT